MIVNASDAVFGILPRTVFDMIFRAMPHLLLMQTDSAMTMHAPNSIR